MKLPGPDHPITVEANPNRVRVLFNGHTVADSKHALVLRESSYRPVFYIPRADADMAMLEPTSHASHCPYKGDASYFSIRAGDRVATNAVWSYEEPFPAMAEIAGHLAFYPDRVDAIEEVGEGRP
jgi:uncharacterized protein (DUF427 family)